ncbi:hypothetical protein HBA_0744 [Sodalis endosymbiont of Henestaris halophilus]|nr:hypothetical protein HBA_0744 [Sodalis endosymbiont of Henestaris halophilus]
MPKLKCGNICSSLKMINRGKGESRSRINKTILRFVRNAW